MNDSYANDLFLTNAHSNNVFNNANFEVFIENEKIIKNGIFYYCMISHNYCFIYLFSDYLWNFYKFKHHKQDIVKLLRKVLEIV